MNDLFLKKSLLSLALGHNRAHILNAYVGTINAKSVLASVQRCKSNIEGSGFRLAHINLPKVEGNRIDDCLNIQKILASVDINIPIDVIHFFWCANSKRHGFQWIKPTRAIVIQIEAAALTTTKKLM